MQLRTDYLDARLGPPVALSALPCGNIDPLGITGTPVIDERRRRSISTRWSPSLPGRAI